MEIVNKAFVHIMSKTAVESLRYLLTYCKKNYIFPTVVDTSIFELLCNYKSIKCRQIMKLLLSHEIIIAYSDAEAQKLELLALGVKDKDGADFLAHK